MVKLKWRIRSRGDKYYIQIKDFLFWSDVGESLNGAYPVITYFNSINEANEAVRNYIFYRKNKNNIVASGEVK